MNLAQQCKTSTLPATTQDEEVVLLTWHIHLLRRNPGRAGTVFFAMILAALFGFLLLQSLFFALI
ncbi:MAG TPA: hypothetical protein VNJ09_10305, partial [Chthonomonadales bacterium]|nr:hypothetical protein [Chthonomonadales bacterium]